jgi:hypothetical protein
MSVNQKSKIEFIFPVLFFLKAIIIAGITFLEVILRLEIYFDTT